MSSKTATPALTVSTSLPHSSPAPRVGVSVPTQLPHRLRNAVNAQSVVASKLNIETLRSSLAKELPDQ